ncbi:unnamed protein product [Bursaphelenchus xylophilus]|uniref:Tyrosine-protein kinase n=1 Tax=Bursaphelenchus xylophilus TaxID=6326 RepID=A0A1I7RN96_BURXY|nr:unnamed protein product [Bursaphelenchus xylophilus]CAG9123785.1 unnamed protein product [Bursaphelenchus xylophilus]
MEEVLRHEKWFFGYVSRKFVEKYLKNPGDWCVRSNCRKDFGRVNTEHFVCVKKSDGQIHDYVLKFDKRKGWYFGGTESEVYPSLETLLHSKTETIQKLQLLNAADRPPILIPPGSLEWENCDANLLGKGSYGTVVRAKATINKVKFDVAVKIPQTAPTVPKLGSKRNTQKEVMLEVEQMLHEAEVMRHFHHENILRCFGIDTSEDTIRLVLSLCPGGSLLEHLHHNGEEIRFEEKLIFSLEAARGLKYLHTKWKCIHRDMAARNCLIAKDGKLKLSDFGICMMEGVTNTNEDKIKVPIPWLAPECLTARPRFSTKSDVFSFAIFMYEIVTNGQKPWPEYGRTEDIMRLVRCGKRMTIPASTHKEFQQIITACWAHLPYGRPEIWEVVFFIRRLLNSSGIPKPEHRSLAKLSKGIIPVPFTEDPEDFELDECSPPPTSEEVLRMDRITQERQKRLRSPSVELSSDDFSSDFHGHTPKHKNRISRNRIPSSEPMSRPSDNSSSAEFRGKNRNSQSDRPRPSPARSSNSKPPTPSARKSLNTPSRALATARRVSTPSKLFAPPRRISSTPMRTARANADRMGSSTMSSAQPVIKPTARISTKKREKKSDTDNE